MYSASGSGIKSRTMPIEMEAQSNSKKSEEQGPPRSREVSQMSRSNLNSSVYSQRLAGSVAPSSVFSSQSATPSRQKEATKSVTSPAEKQNNNKKKKSEPTCCSVSLVVVFGIACVVIAVVFGAITAYSSISFNDQVEASVKQNLAIAMQGAMKYITDPLIQSQQYAEQLKTMIEANPSRYSCDDSVRSFPGNTSATNFYYEAGMYALHRPGIAFIYQSRLSKRYLRTDGTGPAGVCCVIDAGLKRVYYMVNNTMQIMPYTNGTYFETLSSQVSTIEVPLDITSLSMIQGPPKINVSGWVSDSVSPAAGLAEPTNKYSYIVRLTDPDDPTAVWAVSIDHNMVDLKDTLLQATPPITVGDSETVPTQVSGAHTTIYDINEGLLMASTHEDVPVAKEYGVLFPMGESPAAVVNEALSEAKAKCGTTGCTDAVVTIGSSTVHTAYRINVPGSKLHLMMVSSVPKEHFFAEATQTFAVTLGLAILCCVLIMVGCIVLLIVIRRPLSSLKENMLLAAELHNDRVDHTRTYLREIADVSAVFDGMNQQLLIARSFVPEAVLLGKSDDTEDVEDEGSVVTDAEGKSAKQVKGKSNEESTNIASTLDGTRNTNNTTNSSNRISKLFNINEKRVAVLSLNLVGFHALCTPERQYSRSQKINDLSSCLLAMAVSCAHRERGVMDSFHGDHFTLTFNASRSVSGPLAAAVRTANAFIAEAHDCDQLGGAVCGVAAGAAVGKAHVGTYGMDGYRRLSVIGEVYRNANALQQAAVQFLRMNAGMGFREGCMVEESSQRDLGHCAIHLQVAGCIQSSQHRVTTLSKDAGSSSTTPPLVFFAMDVGSDTFNGAEADGEWLYELDAIEATDPFLEPNRAMRALMEGDMALCGQLLDSRDAVLLKRRSTHNAAIDESSVPRRSTSTSFTATTAVRAFDEESLSSTAPVDMNPGSLTGDNPSPSQLAWLLVRRCYTHTEQVSLDLSGSPNAASAVVRQCSLPYLLFQQ